MFRTLTVGMTIVKILFTSYIYMLSVRSDQRSRTADHVPHVRLLILANNHKVHRLSLVL